MFTLNVPYGTMDTETGKYTHVAAMDDAFASLRERFVSLFEENRRLAETNKKLEEGTWADEELARMRQELKEMRADYLRGFPLTEAEFKRAKEWIEKHDNEVHPKAHKLKIAINAPYDYIFTPTSIGTIASVKCNRCGEEFVITDYADF